jgi:hypothetical protein
MKYIITFNNGIINISNEDDFNSGFDSSYEIGDDLNNLLNQHEIYELMEGIYEGTRRNLNNLLNNVSYRILSDNRFEIEI